MTNPVFVDGAAPSKADARAFLGYTFGDADALRALVRTVEQLAYVKSLSAFFEADTSDTTSADNGITVIVDATGVRWKEAGGAQINDISFHIDAAGTFSERSGFDGEAQGFVYLATDGDPSVSPAITDAVLFFKQAGSPAQWSDAVLFVGSGFIQAGDDAVPRTMLDKVREIVSVKDFGATGLDNALIDDTAAFAAACAAAFHVYVPPGRYRIGDLTIPSGVTLFGASPKANLNYTDGVSEIRKWSGASNHIFNTNGEDGITIQGLLINGIDRSVIGIQGGGDNVTLRDLVVHVCSIGFGTAFGSGVVPQTAQIDNCHLVNNIFGIRNIIDTTILGGAVTSNKSHGIYLPSGASYNNIFTRVEHNGEDTTASPPANGFNVHAEDCKDNTIGAMIDHGYLGGVSLVRCENTRVVASMKHNGRSDAGNDQEDCHVMLEDCTNCVVDITTRAGEGDPGPPSSPKYSIWLHGESTQNENITIMGDVNGFEDQALIETGNATTNLLALANGIPASRRNGSLGTWHVLAASAVAVSHTGDTSETTLATISVPADAMGANGVLRITTVWTVTNSVNNKIERVRFGGTQFTGVIVTANASLRQQTQIHNRNAADSQHGFSLSQVGGFGNTTAANVTGTVDTTSAQNITITAQLENSAETITLESYVIELLRAD